MNLIKKTKSLTAAAATGWQNFLIRLSRNSNQPLNQPTSIIFNLTPNCVLRCRQCDIWQNHPEAHLSYDNACLILDKLHHWFGHHYVFFTGGEPLMNPHLPEIINHGFQLGILSHINSNAVLINPKMAQKLADNHLFAISISLDGAAAKTHDYLRGVPGTYRQVMAALKLLRRHPNLSVYLNTVIMKPNQDELIPLIKLAQKNKVKGITFQCLLPNLGPNANKPSGRSNPLWPEPKVISILQKIAKIASKNPIILNRPADFQLAMDYYQNPQNLDHLTCAAGINNFIIDHHGDVRLCFSFPPIGNILKEDPQAIWFGPKAQKQRIQIRQCQRHCKIIACNRTDTRRHQTSNNLFG